MKKTSYPNDSEQFLSGDYDVESWIDAAKYLLFKTKHGERYDTVMKYITEQKNWNNTEKQAFVNWIKFYEQGNHLKYKMAQEEERTFSNTTYGGPGYFLPINGKQVEAQSYQSNLQNSPLAPTEDPKEAEKLKEKAVYDAQKAIINRLTAAENLIISQRGNVDPGTIQQILDSLHSLKRQVLSLKKISSAQRIYHDLVFREINRLSTAGFVKAASRIEKIVLAQGALPPATPAATPTTPTGTPAGQTAPLPGLPGAPGATPPSGAETTITAPPPSKGMDKFMKGLSDKHEANDDELYVDDNEGAYDEEAGDVLTVSDNTALSVDAKFNKANILLKLAQEISPAAATAVSAAAPAGNKNYEQLLDNVFATVTVADVVQKLEDISSIFKHREIPRQLAIVDLMLEQLKLSSYFPSLAEASNKAIESNQYIFNRVEEILSKLKGSLANNAIDLAPAEAIKQNLDILEQNKRNKDEEKVKEQIKGPETEAVNLGELSPEAAAPPAPPSAPPQGTAPAPPQTAAPAPVV